MPRYLTTKEISAHVKEVFAHPVEEPAWYWKSGWESPSINPRQSVTFLTELYSKSAVHLAPYSDAQINQGLWYLVSPGSSPYIEGLLSDAVDWPERLLCIQAISKLFDDIFNKRCLPQLSHRNTNGDLAQQSPLNLMCYMFWDLIPFGDDRRIQAAYLDEMEKIIWQDNVACQESALHGLSHSLVDYPDRVRSIIDQFLDAPTWRREDVKEYARNAREGAVL